MELDELLTHAVKRQASDLHLKADAHPVLRIHGHLEVQDDLPKVTREFMRRNAMRLLGEDRYNDLMGGAEKDLGYQVDGAGRFRVNLFLSQGEVRGVMRHIPGKIPAFEDLHLPKVLERLAMERRGMVLGARPERAPRAATLAARRLEPRPARHTSSLPSPIAPAPVRKPPDAPRAAVPGNRS